MTKGLNIVSRLTFENIPDGTLPNYIPDENKYSNYSYTKSGTVTVETIDGIKFIKLNSNSAKICSSFIITDQSKKNFQAEFDVIFDNIKAETNLVSIGVTNLLNALRVVASNNPAQGLRLINGNNQISSYYRFENNKKYTICVGFKDNVISMYVDGTIIGYSYSEEFINSLNITNPSNIILGAPLNNTNDTNATLYGKLGNINISSGPTVKHEESYTKYGTNLVSFLNFENLAGIGTYKTGVEAVYEGIEWRGVESVTYSNGYGNIKNISTNLTGDFTVKFSLKKFKVANANILKYGNYSVDYAAGFIPVPDPDVEVNEYTTAALNFENGLVDQIGTTVWTKEGTSDITSVNKIFGENSFETKALGDSLSTTSKLITGGATPFTIEFYALIKNRYGPTEYDAPLISQSKSVASGEQQLNWGRTIRNVYFYKSDNNTPSLSPVVGKYKFNYNEINKYTITYDSSAIRIFINDKLDSVNGTLNGWNKTDNPIRFLDSLVPTFESFRHGTLGIIDNINIHDGIATKVRDPDPYEEYLVVDLAFDGENNSTKIVDNSGDVLRSTNPYNNNIISLLHFEGIDDSNIIIDETGRIWNVLGSSKIKTDQKIIGSSSCYFNGNSSVSSSNSSDFAYGPNNFTWEFFTRLNVINENQYFIDHRQSDGNDGTVSYYRNMLRYYNPTIGINSPLYNTNISLDINKWYHIAIVRNNNITSIYIDGIIRATGSDSHNFGNMECWLGAYSRGGNSLNGYIDEFRIIKGKAVYTENFTPPTEPFNYIPKNNWIVNGNAKISTAQKFDGFSSLFYTGGRFFTPISKEYFTINQNEDVTLTLDYYCTDSSSNTKGLIQLFKGSSDRISFYLWTPNRLRIYFDGLVLSDITLSYDTTNKWVRYRVIISNNNWYIYANNILVGSFYNEKKWSGDFKIFLGESGSDTEKFSGYFKNFKIYKGAAVIPEDPTGKIQLDFDNNFNDKYDNSTWANNGVTFDQVNSVKGYAAYFDGNALGIKSGINNNLNFENKNFIIDFDFKAIELGRQYSSTIITSTQVGSYTSFSVSIPNGSTAISVSTTNDSMTGWGVSLFSAGTTILTNDYRNICVSRINNIFMLKDNDVIRSIANINTTQSLFNLNGGNDTIIGTNRNDLVGTKFKGYIDNFKSIKDYQENVVIDRPAVHLPLETNAINTGFTSLTINSVGNPTYTTIDGKKCIKFESGKYLTINSNNIFNLGTNSDFYIEFDFMLDGTSTTDRYLLSPVAMWSSSKRISYLFVRNSTNKLVFQTGNNATTEVSVTSNNSLSNDTFYNCKLTRFGNVFKILINNEVWITSDNVNLDLSQEGTYIGYTPVDGYLKGYMSNFKMFVGTSQPPETYNDKKVLDLDFKPTGKSYLFKDNNNKCVIHPVNITQRDYQNSQYCCSFNGADQYLQLGKNDIFNFGLDDFVINVKFRKSINSILYGCLIANGQPTSTSMDAIMIRADNSISIRMNQIAVLSATNINISDTNINDLTIIRSNGLLTILLNGANTNIVDKDANYDFNLNRNSNTYIGKNNWDGSNGYFQGDIYSIKILRNTTDLSLLEDENTDVIIGDTTLTLSNGTDSQEVIFDNKNQNDFRFVHSNDSTKLIVNEQILEVPNVENESNELSLFTDFNAEVKDIKTYNIAFEDEDSFSGNVPIHTQLGEIEEISTLSDDFIVVDQGDFIVKGFFEGRPEDSRYQIQNRFDKFIVHTGSGPFNYNGLNERFIDDYEIYLPDTKETMPIPTETMERGYITISITPTECEGINFGVKVFRRSDNKLIGIYDFNNYICTIDNLDCNKRYDCVIFDKDVNLESRCLSNRTPMPY